jgi:hypothetical protein
MVTTLGLLGLMHELQKEILLSALLLKEKDCRIEPVILGIAR